MPAERSAKRWCWGCREECDAPTDARAARAADLQALDVVGRVQRLFGSVPVLEAKIDPRPEHLDPQFSFQLLDDQRAWLAVRGLLGGLDRLTVEHWQLTKVTIRNDPGLRPAAGCGHVHLALQQRLRDVQVGIELAGMKHLAGDLAASRSLDFFQIVHDRDVAHVGRRGIQRAADLQRLLAARVAQDRERSHGSNGRAAQCPARQTFLHRYPFPGRP